MIASDSNSSAPPSAAAPEAPAQPRLGRWAWLLPLAWVALLAEALFGSGVLSQADALLMFEPWREVQPAGHRPANLVLLDQGIVMQPWLEFFAERLRAGEAPLWNPDNYLGQPIHAANTGGLLWPPHLLYYLWPGPGTLVFLALIKLLLGGLGFQRLGVSLGLSPAAATAGALVFGLGGFHVAWLGHPHTAAACLLPWLLLAVERVRRGPSRVGRLGFALGVAGLGVSGHLQTALHVGLLVVAWSAWRLLFTPEDCARLGLRGLRDLTLTGLAGLALAAPQLLPFFEYLGHSRAQELFDQIDVTAEVDALTAAERTFNPLKDGSPRTGNYRGPSGPNLNFNELLGPWIGRLAWALALIGLWRERKRTLTWLLSFVAILGLTAAWQFPGVYEALREVPVLRSTKLMRLALWSNFALALLAAFGAGHVARACGAWARPMGALLGMGLAAELLLFARGYNPTIDPALFAPSTPTIEHLQERDDLTRVGVTEGSTLLANANLFHGLPVITGYDSIEDDASADLIGRLSNDARAEWFVKEIRAFDRAVPLWSGLAVSHVLSRAPLPAPLVLEHTGPTGLAVYRNPDALPLAYVAEAVWVEADPAERLARLGAEDWNPRHAFVDERPPGFAEDSAATGPGRVTSFDRAARRWTLDAQLEAPGLLVCVEADDPGWHVRVNGKSHTPVRVNHALRGVWLSAGTHTVEWRYVPGSWRLGWALAAAAAALLAWGARRPRP
ncbi:MAG: YfhO family protein [Planctomycetota bacterium]